MSATVKRRRLSFVLGGGVALESRSLLSVAVHHVPVSAADHFTRRLEPAPSEVRILHAQTQTEIHVAPHPQNRHNQPSVAPTSNRWSWMAGTYWYVPTANLQATLYNSSTGTLSMLRDQTVFQVTGYSGGYFWGKVVAQFGSSAPSGSSMVGSVTPEGKVLLLFTQSSADTTPSVTQGYGTMVRKFGQWTMENQMFTPPGSTIQIGHWAYMVQTRPRMVSWNHLPSVGVSVPTFLSESTVPAPQPVGL